MFSRFSRLPLRRCLHTSSSSAQPAGLFGKTAKFAFGLSAATATYMTWQLAQGKNKVSMDSTRTLNSTERSQPTNLTQSVEPSEPSPSPTTVTADVFVPDAPSGPDSTSLPTSDTTDSSTEETSSTEGEGSAHSGQAAGGGGAFNPETGEINWDCPCLGGMADGPCGPEFKEAFSCFVFSEAEPKGINCVDKFQNMQNCFRAHPEVYADEIVNDDDDEEVPAPADVEGVNASPPSEHLGSQKLETERLSTVEKSSLDATTSSDS